MKYIINSLKDVEKHAHDNQIQRSACIYIYTYSMKYIINFLNMTTKYNVAYIYIHHELHHELLKGC